MRGAAVRGAVWEREMEGEERLGKRGAKEEANAGVGVGFDMMRKVLSNFRLSPLLIAGKFARLEAAKVLPSTSL